MLSVSKLNTNENFRARTFHKSQVVVSPENLQAKALYFDMNKQAFTDFAGGDISLFNFLGQKVKKYWHLFTANSDPVLELKAKIIEDNIKNMVKNSDIKSKKVYVA